MVDVLPDSRAAVTRNRVKRPDGWWVPIFCANCGTDGGTVPEENMTFAFYLCPPCAGTYGEIAGHYLMPDHVFWDLVKEEQLDRHKRLLSPVELMRELENPDSAMSILARERTILTPCGA